MSFAALWLLIRRDLVRVRGALMTSGFGIAAGTAALVFFLALGLGVRDVLLGEVFPIDQVELEPPKAKDPGLLGAMFGGATPGIEEEKIERLRQHPAAKGVYPKLRFSFPGQAGGELMGRKIGTKEIIGDGVDPALVQDDVLADLKFSDPLETPGAKCWKDKDCEEGQYCEGPSGVEGVCSDPVPVLASEFMVEMFDKSIAPAHNLPPMGRSIIERASGLVFWMWLGESMLGKSKKGKPRKVLARLVGVSPRAIDLGITVPIQVVRRWNAEYSGPDAAKAYSSVLIKTHTKEQVSEMVSFGGEMELSPKDTRARDVSVLVTGVIMLLALVAAIILIVSASNIAYTFRVFVNERRQEIALYRALGASAGDMVKWLLGLALTVGLTGGAVGLVLAYAGSRLCNRLAATRLPDFPFKPDEFFSFPPWLLFGGLGFAALFALLGAFGPARRAGKVDPAAALAVL